MALIESLCYNSLECRALFLIVEFLATKRPISLCSKITRPAYGEIFSVGSRLAAFGVLTGALPSARSGGVCLECRV